ncbi:peptidase [Solihabitans fulvus]|uniref:Peptidase n=1 Tax=Solihabitans fulvus TaxID=1892852 RepID=A0A5B2WJ89_9PSEU|nr:peptidase [Solihabitans fulvus]KAA2250978.1 peptidase [Solihabitans fulvus]
MFRGPRPTRSRVLAGLALAGVLTGAAVVPAAFADTPTTPAAAAAGWLARQLVDGDHFETTADNKNYPDAGLTADAVLAFDSAKVAQDAATKATAWLAKPDTLAGYVGDGAKEFYAGAHAKLALVAQAQGQDPAAFGGRDLLAALRSLQAPSGRLSDRSEYGDYSNGITQAFAVIALQRAGDRPVAAANYLVGTQCQDGGFPLYLEKSPCASDVDTTGFAAQALLAVGNKTAAGKALDWLAAGQKSDGGFGGSGPTSGENANSTGLAAQALRAGGRADAADRASAYLTSLQVGCGDPKTAGAIAYDGKGYVAGNAVRTTAQAVPGLGSAGLDTVSAKGSRAEAPTPNCPATSTSATPTSASTAPTSAGASSAVAVPPATVPTTGGTPAEATPAGNDSAPVNTAATATLADTGVNAGPPLTIGALLILAGAAALVLARRRAGTQG